MEVINMADETNKQEEEGTPKWAQALQEPGSVIKRVLSDR